MKIAKKILNENFLIYCVQIEGHYNYFIAGINFSKFVALCV